MAKRRYEIRRKSDNELLMTGKWHSGRDAVEVYHNSYGDEDVVAIMPMQKGKCTYCHKEFESKRKNEYCSEKCMKTMNRKIHRSTVSDRAIRDSKPSHKAPDEKWGFVFKTDKKYWMVSDQMRNYREK